ncbi:MAG: hypothetical protein ACPGSD_17720 [Flavobacteriales bacterium]|jgi:hypothetical protein
MNDFMYLLEEDEIQALSKTTFKALKESLEAYVLKLKQDRKYQEDALISLIQGYIFGYKQGVDISKKRSATELLKLNYDIDLIISITGLKYESILELQKGIKKNR